MILAEIATKAVVVEDKLRAVPTKFWFVVGGTVLAIVIVVTFLRKIANMNKIFVAIFMALAFALVCFNWVYQRNEPKFLTPYVDKVAPWFPSYQSAQPLKADPPKS